MGSAISLPSRPFDLTTPTHAHHTHTGPAEGKQLATIMLRFNRLGACLVHDPAAAAPGADAGAQWEALATQRELKRRYYMVQRARDAQVLGTYVRATDTCTCQCVPCSVSLLTQQRQPTTGIVVGTLGVSRYLRVVASVRRLVERAGKKAYTLVVGKLNPAKLANFAEVSRQFLVFFGGVG